MHDWIMTVSRQHVDGFNPSPKTIRIRDIAWHLAKQCRYNNHLLQHYSNAEHSVLVMQQCTGEKLMREGLLHDKAEYVFGDMGSPIKQHYPDYRRDIDKFDVFLNRHFLGYPDLSPLIKQYDLAVTDAERCFFLGMAPQLPSIDIRFECWSVEKAYDEFMRHFDKLFPNYKDYYLL